MDVSRDVVMSSALNIDFLLLAARNGEVFLALGHQFT
jgi:hypothetical protein